MVNLERCLKVGDRLDGHRCRGMLTLLQSVLRLRKKMAVGDIFLKAVRKLEKLVVYKGSICINGVSLTVTKTINQEIEVAIIPYTYEHTNFKQIEVGDLVNIEFDIGKYLLKTQNLIGPQ